MAKDDFQGWNGMTQEDLAALIDYLYGGAGPVAPGLPPGNLDAAFGVVPGGLSPINQGNYLRGHNTLLADHMTATQAGAGAYANNAFDPQVTTTPVDAPGRRMLDFYLQSDQNSIEYLIADHITREGGTPATALQLINQIIDDPEHPDHPSLVAQLPKRYDSFGTDLGPDKNWPHQFTQQLTQDLAKDPQGDFQDEQGNWFKQEVEESPAAKWHRERGLSLPTEQYDAGMLMGPEWQQQQQQYLGLRDQQTDDIAQRRAMTGLLMPDKRSQLSRPAAPGSPQSAPGEALGSYMADVMGGLGQEPGSSRRPPGNFASGSATGAPGAALGSYMANIMGNLGQGGPETNAYQQFLTQNAASFNPGFTEMDMVGRQQSQGVQGGQDPRAEAPKKGKPTAGKQWGSLGPRGNANGGGRRQEADLLDARIRERKALERQMREALFNPDFMRTAGMVARARDEGRTPLTDQLAQRRMVPIAGGMFGAGHFPGQGM